MPITWPLSSTQGSWGESWHPGRDVHKRAVLRYVARHDTKANFESLAPALASRKSISDSRVTRATPALWLAADITCVISYMSPMPTQGIAWPITLLSPRRFLRRAFKTLNDN
jgi:hypothetical protein